MSWCGDCFYCPVYLNDGAKCLNDRFDEINCSNKVDVCWKYANLTLIYLSYSTLEMENVIFRNIRNGYGQLIYA